MQLKPSLFHVRLTVHGRRRENSIAQRLAYISAGRLRDGYTGEWFDNRCKQGVLLHGCVGYAGRYDELVAAVDASERRCNANTCRELIIALPCGLPLKTRRRLLLKFARQIQRRWGVVVVFALHAPGPYGDDRNEHGHLVFTTRVFKDGAFREKTRFLDVPAQGRKEVVWLRAMISHLIGRILHSVGRGGEREQWDHRSYLDRGELRQPTTHDGLARRQLKLKRGQHKPVHARPTPLSKEELNKLAELCARMPQKPKPAPHEIAPEPSFPMYENLSKKLNVQRRSPRGRPPDFERPGL